MIDKSDRAILRELAKRVAEIAALPVQAERREAWKRHNSLTSRRPMILLFPEGSWEELLPETALSCSDAEARRVEAALRRRIYYHEHFADDTVIEREWIVEKAIERTGWGIKAQRHDRTAERGSWSFDPVLKEPSDLAKLRYPEVTHDEDESARRLVEAQELFGDILDVKVKGFWYVAFHFTQLYTSWRGLAEAMYDMAANPSLVHEAMTFIQEGYKRTLDAFEGRNLLSLNNDSAYQGSGGNGYTDELPGEGFDPSHVRLRDIWGSAESQEMAQVSPAMHEEFALRYERPLLERMGLAGYGCCEDLTRKLDDVLKISNIRRISISPWANVDICAEKLGGRAIFSWKPNPAHLVGTFDAEAVRAYVGHAVDAALANGCVLEIVLKDTHTCENRPERFDEWTRVARSVAAEKAAGVE